MSSSQMILSNFGIWYREGPQKQKILSFYSNVRMIFGLKFNFVGINCIQFRVCFLNHVSQSKRWLFKKLKTMKSKDFQNQVWRLNSTSFSDGETTLSWIFWLKFTELWVSFFLSFWGPSLYQIPSFDEFIWLELISTLRRT